MTAIRKMQTILDGPFSPHANWQLFALDRRAQKEVEALSKRIVGPHYYADLVRQNERVYQRQESMQAEYLEVLERWRDWYQAAIGDYRRIH